MTILCISSYEKGHDFLRECAASGERTLLLTVEKLKDAAWPRDVLADVRLLPDFDDAGHVLNAVAWLARTEPIARIVALDEFDMELAALLREHLRVRGRSVTATRVVRDKLAMREAARSAGVRVPDFVGVIHHDDVRGFLDRAPGPWVLKPRTQASAIGIRKLGHAGELWRIIEELGDEQSHHLLERFVPGDVYHVDGIISGGEVSWAEVHRYAKPPFDVMHGGGIFASRTVPRGGDEEAALLAELARLVEPMGLENSVVHAEFIRAHEDGACHFLEVAARVGGAHIADMVEAATGANLWREWARLELAQARDAPYEPPPLRREHAGVLVSLARQEWPDTSGYDDPEVVWRLQKRHHAGLVMRSPGPERVGELLEAYMRRFQDDFHASMPAPDRATQ